MLGKDNILSRKLGLAMQKPSSLVHDNELMEHCLAVVAHVRQRAPYPEMQSRCDMILARFQETPELLPRFVLTCCNGCQPQVTFTARDVPLLPGILAGNWRCTPCGRPLVLVPRDCPDGNGTVE
jgi:hypothetical protein